MKKASLRSADRIIEYQTYKNLAFDRKESDQEYEIYKRKTRKQKPQHQNEERTTKMNNNSK